VYRKKKRERERLLFEETSGISRSYIRLPAKKSVRRATREQISPLSKQLLGIAVTQRGSGPYYGPNETTERERERERECVSYEESKAERSWGASEREGGRGRRRGECADEENKKLPYGTFRVLQPGVLRGRRGRWTSVSGQSVDKRVVRTVLNRSEYLYTRVLSSHLFLPLSSSSPPRVSTFASDILLITRS